MILKAGKFYDADGNVVPLEHGNKEQVWIMERWEEYKEGTIVVDSFFCFCSNPNSISWNEGTVKCYTCGQQYKCYIEDDVPFVKTIINAK